MPLPDPERHELLRIARESIRRGLLEGLPLEPDLEALPSALRDVRATFVTLELDGVLRGCIGTLEPRLPLARDVAGNAFRAAFSDPRFPPVTDREQPRLDLHISILSPREPLAASSLEELLRQLRPGVDGLVVSDGFRRATFLPAVWEDLPDKALFVRHLFRKAGLDEARWSRSLRFERYTAECFGEGAQ